MPRGTPSWTPFFDRFLIDFWSIFRPPEPQKSLKFYWFYKYVCKIGLPKLTSIFDPILVPTYLHFGTKNPTNSPQTSIPRDIKKWSSLGSIFLAILAPFGSQVGARLAPFSPKVGRCCGVLPSSLFRCFFYPTFSWFWSRLCTNFAWFWRLWTPSGGLLALFLLFLVLSCRHFGTIGHKKGPGWNQIFWYGPAECAKRLNPPAHLWWCYERVKQMLTEILLPSFSEGETIGPRIPPGRTPLSP